MKVLIAEDQPMILKALVFKMKKAGYEVIAAIDGQQAIELFESEKPDMVITDLYMPFSTGFELITYIRKNCSSSVPILVLSNVGLEQTIVDVFDLGASDFVQKPYRPNELVIRTKRLITNNQGHSQMAA
ncbi:MAG: response regulator transcription factor [Chitinophagales bacterium]